MPIHIHNGNFTHSIFPGGEVHVKVLHAPTDSYVTADIRSSDEVMLLLLLADALKREGKNIAELKLVYLPYARQDRVCATGEALSCAVMARLINLVEARRVVIYDPHSDVMPALLDNCRIKNIDSFGLDGIIGDKLIICPDAGAEKRILKLRKPYIMATKVRDAVTGNIIKTEVHIGDLSGKSCIIIDDICDGGRTFIELAKVLRAKGATSIELFVTYGIFSQGTAVFRNHIDTLHYYNNSTIVTENLCA